MICHECSSYRQRESLPFKRKICIYVSLSSFAFGLIGLQVWFWYPEQCRVQMLHLLFSPSLAGCSYCSCLTFWILCPIMAAWAPSAARESHRCQRLGAPYKGRLSFWVDAWRAWGRENGLVLSEKGVTRVSELREKERKKRKKMKVRCLIGPTCRIIHCPWGEK